MILISNVQTNLSLFDFKVVRGPDINKLSDRVLSRLKHLSEINNFIYQNKLDSVGALCSKKMALKILRNAFKKGYNN